MTWALFNLEERYWVLPSYEETDGPVDEHPTFEAQLIGTYDTADDARDAVDRSAFDVGLEVDWDDPGFEATVRPPRGRLHRHANGVEHRHFSLGTSLAGEADRDGSEDHAHNDATVAPGVPGGTGVLSSFSDSGPVVWIEQP